MNLLKRLWCDWTHGGGDIKRDPSGSINWQCRKCERWGDPVPLCEEARVIDAEIRNHSNKKHRIVTYVCPVCAASLERQE